MKRFRKKCLKTTISGFVKSVGYSSLATNGVMHASQIIAHDKKVLEANNSLTSVPCMLSSTLNEKFSDLLFSILGSGATLHEAAIARDVTIAAEPGT